MDIFSDLAAIELGRRVIQADDEWQYEQLLEVREILRGYSVAADERHERLGKKLMELLDMALPGKRKSIKKRKATK